MNVLVAIYNPIDLYPPTINAVEQLSEKYPSVTLLTNGIENEKRWIFPKNVISIYIKNWHSRKADTLSKLTRFIKYVYKLIQLLTKGKCYIMVLYEPHAALAYAIAKRFIHKKPAIIWYHNHDIYEIGKQPKFSLGWFAASAELNQLSRYSIFSLPANERKTYFPLQKFKGKYFFLPNYPSKKFYSKYYEKKILKDELRLVYQGIVSEGHGLEEIIKLLPERIFGKELTLHIVGPSDLNYLKKLEEKACFYSVKSQLYFYGLTKYSKVPKFSASCHIGLGILTNTDINHYTAGTASNKIYEYAAAGLPVILYDSEHYRKHLGIYNWAFFTDCSKQSLKKCIEEIIVEYDKVSEGAYQDFLSTLNFESNFKKVTNFIDEKLEILPG